MRSRESKLNPGIVSVGLAIALILALLLLACSDGGDGGTADAPNTESTGPSTFGEAFEEELARDRAARSGLAGPTPTPGNISRAFLDAFNAPRPFAKWSGGKGENGPFSAFLSPDERVRFEFEHDGDGLFTVSLIKTWPRMGKMLQLVQKRGKVRGYVDKDMDWKSLSSSMSPGQYSIKVLADGEWSLTITDLVFSQTCIVI